MRKFFFVLFILSAGGFVYHALSSSNFNFNSTSNSTSTNAQPDSLGTISQWFAQAVPTKPVWTAPVNPQYPSEWTTTDGQKFSKVKVTLMEADAVTIMHSAGVSVIDLAVLPPDLQRTFNYIPECAQAAALKRKNAEENSYQGGNHERQVWAHLEIGDTSRKYAVSTYEFNRVTFYQAKLEKLRTEIKGYMATADASYQKVQADLAALNKNNPQAVEAYNAEAKQCNDYKDWVDQQINDFNTQQVNLDNELKANGTLKQ